MTSIGTWFDRQAPIKLIAAVVLAKALLFLFALPLLQTWIAPNYGIGFADNYDVLAWNLSQGNGYRFFADTAPTMMREPGYPLVLAGIFHFFGRSLPAARVFNLCFSLASAWMLVLLARRVAGSERVARAAPLLFLVHPGMVLAEARGGVESLFIMLLLAFFLLLYRALNSGRLRDYLVAGMLLGLSANVRSTALLFPVFMLLYFWFWERIRPSLVTMIARVAVLMAAAFMMLTPWIVRNHQLVGRFVPTASVASVSAQAGYYICTHLSFTNSLEAVDGEAGVVRAQVARDNGIRFKEMANLYYLYFFDPHDELAYNKVLGARVLDAYLASPLLLPTCAAKNFFNFWFSGKSWPVTAINFVIQLPYLVLAGWGLILSLRSSRTALIAPIFLFIVYTLCVYLPILAQARYSIHLLPFLAILAAIPMAQRLRTDS